MQRIPNLESKVNEEQMERKRRKDQAMQNGRLCFHVAQSRFAFFCKFAGFVFLLPYKPKDCIFFFALAQPLDAPCIAQAPYCCTLLMNSMSPYHERTYPFPTPTPSQIHTVMCREVIPFLLWQNLPSITLDHSVHSNVWPVGVPKSFHHFHEHTRDILHAPSFKCFKKCLWFLIITLAMSRLYFGSIKWNHLWKKQCECLTGYTVSCALASTFVHGPKS